MSYIGSGFRIHFGNTYNDVVIETGGSLGVLEVKVDRFVIGSFSLIAALFVPWPYHVILAGVGGGFVSHCVSRQQQNTYSEYISKSMKTVKDVAKEWKDVAPIFGVITTVAGTIFSYLPW